jgi:SAM-dependent methyltransferase
MSDGTLARSYVHARLEDMQLRRESCEAVFSASAIHWVDPDLSWRKIAEALAPGGTLALISSGRLARG